VPKIIINNTVSLFFKTVISILLFSNQLLLCILFEKYVHILALEMASPRNQHCANCIGTLSFPICVVHCCHSHICVFVFRVGIVFTYYSVHRVNL